MEDLKEGTRVLVCFDGSILSDEVEMHFGTTTIEGEIVGEKHGEDYTISTGKDIGTYRECLFSGYKSEIRDLIVAHESRIKEVL